MATADSSAPAPEDDGALVGRARRGDGAAFRALYDRHAPAVLAFLVRLLETRGRAEDALADVFVKAHAGLATFDSERSFAGWLVGIARRVAIDARRTSAKHGEAPDFSVAASSAPGPAAVASERESETRALELLATLPERSRQVMLLRYRQGLTQSETAAALGCSRRLVATIQKEALVTLARLARESREEVL